MNTKYKFIIGIVVSSFFLPKVGYSLTNGPSQPEVQQFTPISAGNWVNLFTGSFAYNIPLFELPGPNGGYPFNLGYKSGVTMDQEATWVGLGWNVAVGSVNRQMRCLPDEFDGTEKVIKTYDQLDQRVIGMGMMFDYEYVGLGSGDVVPSGSYGLSMYFNSYKGFGITTSFGVGATFGKNGANAGIGLTVTNDNQEGTTIAPNLSIGYSGKAGDASVGGSFALGLNYNSRMGLQNISLTPSISARNTQFDGGTMGNSGLSSNAMSAGISATATMSFNNQFITSPSITKATRTSTFQGFFKLGGAIYGNQISAGISGNYSNETLVNKMKPQYYPAYGYLYLQNGADKTDAMLDFIREKDGQLHKDIRNLASPVLTNDLYSVTGQGFSGMFRPYRSDIGTLNDKEVVSTSDGVNVSLDGSVGNLFQVGFSLSMPTTDSKSGKWNNSNADIYSKYKYQPKQINNSFEPYYFQVYGEKNSKDIQATKQMIGGFEPKYIDFKQTGKLDFETTPYLGIGKGKPLQSITSSKLSNRNPRSTDIKQIENKFLYDTLEVPEYNVQFVDVDGQLKTLDRSANQALYKSNHIGAFVVTTTDGSRYVYALPAYNFKQVDASFSTAFRDNKDLANQIPDNKFNRDGSSNYVQHNTTDRDDDNCGYENLDRTEIPAYTYSHLLTAILGPDYIDVTGDGVTEDDMGYWVKFTYKKTNDQSNPYQWRAPFNTANYIEGMHAIDADNMGTYSYGQRENFYLLSAETKTHLSNFYTSQKQDGRGVSTEFQKSNSPLGQYSYKLDSIELLSKLEPSIPIKKIYFQYNQEDLNNPRFTADNNKAELCKGIDNTQDKSRGKLTLKALYTTYGQNERGLKNPYIFNYNEGDGSGNSSEQNPNYNPFKYDRWGSYQNYTPVSDMLEIKYFPYTKQNLAVDTMNKWSSVWHLKEITLPSGAKMQVDYEANRYAYVQDRPAMEMYDIKGINETSDNNGYYPVYKPMNEPANFVTFKLKKPLTSSMTDAQKIAEVKKYIDENKQLYYKLYVDLINDSKRGEWEFVTGYADIESVGYDESDLTIGKVYLKKVNLQQGKNPIRDESPFAIGAWNYLQCNRPELNTNSARGPLETHDRSSKEIMGIIKSFLSVFNPFTGLSEFKNFYKKARDNGWGTKIDYSKSYVRLNSVLCENDTSLAQKFGGGSRVKDILIYESTAQNAELVSGQYYDYTTVENGQKISTGVAANEPSIGGDESSLTYGKIGYLEPKNKTNYLQFSEMPMNESYMPGADIGYSKVTVKSLTTQKVLDKQLSPNVSSTGVTVNEFYTARDFPTIQEETSLSEADKTLRAKNFMKTRPLIGNITQSYLAATQGYYTEVNDMHGKERKVSFYGMDDNGNIINTPISYSEYIYKSQKVKGKNRLVNEIPVMESHLGAIQNKLVGVDFETFVDTRKCESKNENNGGRFNLSVFLVSFIPIPIPTFFPDLGYDERKSFTSVDNKIVHRFGILEKTKIFKEGALTETTNQIYDATTTEPILTTVNNEFADTIFNYNIPAHWINDGMSPSYTNNSLEFTANVKSLGQSKDELELEISSTLSSLLKNGDELLIKSTYVDPTETEPEEDEYTRCIVTKVDGNKIWVQEPNGHAPGLIEQCEVYVVRPSNRNILNNSSGTIVSKSNPLKDIKQFNCQY